jgi:hypothetical protein
VTSSSHNAGFAEVFADALFASLVDLDQDKRGCVEGYDNTGKLIRKQGAIFNSPFALYWCGARGGD